MCRGCKINSKGREGKDMAEEKESGLEELLIEIEEILEQMEDKGISLESSFLLYEEGMKKLKLCNNKIDQVEKKMLVITGQGELEEF